MTPHPSTLKAAREIHHAQNPEHNAHYCLGSSLCTADRQGIIEQIEAHCHVSEMVEALRNMVVIAKLDSWGDSLTGRQLILRDAESMLAKVTK